MIETTKSAGNFSSANKLDEIKAGDKIAYAEFTDKWECIKTGTLKSFKDAYIKFIDSYGIEWFCIETDKRFRFNFEKGSEYAVQKTDRDTNIVYAISSEILMKIINERKQ